MFVRAAGRCQARDRTRTEIDHTFSENRVVKNTFRTLAMTS